MFDPVLLGAAATHTVCNKGLAPPSSKANASKASASKASASKASASKADQAGSDWLAVIRCRSNN